MDMCRDATAPIRRDLLKLGATAVGAASEFSGPGFLLPTRNGALFRWCLEHGLRIVPPMTLMSIGLNEPQGVFLPSIVY